MRGRARPGIRVALCCTTGKRAAARPRSGDVMREVFRQCAQRTACAVGSPFAFLFALGIVVIWAITGPLFGFSDTWQLVINTGTTIVTFLMVFLIQNSQNKDSMAIQLKLNELVAAMEGASNRLIDVEELSEDELVALHKYYAKLVDR